MKPLQLVLEPPHHCLALYNNLILYKFKILNRFNRNLPDSKKSCLKQDSMLMKFFVNKIGFT